MSTGIDQAIVQFNMESLLALIATILAIIAIYQTHRANKFAHRVAEAEGVFEKPKLLISLLGDPTIEDIFLGNTVSWRWLR